MRIFRFAFFSLLMCSCGDPDIVFEVSPELLPYVNSFYEEAAKRNVVLNPELTAEFSDLDGPCGIGSSPEFQGSPDIPAIVIDNACWDGLNEVARELLVYHELGHALLSRKHIDAVLPNGYTKSIMCAGADDECSALPDYGTCIDRRSYYVDELFDTEITPPSWAVRQWQDRATVFTDLATVVREPWRIFTSCPETSYSVAIDSVSSDRPSPYSLLVTTECNDFITLRKRIPVPDVQADQALEVSCDLRHTLQGEGARISVFVKNSEDVFTSFMRSTPSDIVSMPAVIDDYSVIVDCLDGNVDSLNIDFQFLENTAGTLTIGNFAVKVLE